MKPNSYLLALSKQIVGRTWNALKGDLFISMTKTSNFLRAALWSVHSTSSPNHPIARFFQSLFSAYHVFIQVNETLKNEL